MPEPSVSLTPAQRAILTFVFGLFVLGIGASYIALSLFFYAAGATSAGGFVGPIGLIATVVGAVIAVAMLVRGT